MTDPRAASVLVIEPLRARLDATVEVPGSKSITNRVLPVAAVASGDSVLHRIGEGDDVDAMLGALRALGVRIALNETRTASVAGTGGTLPASDVVGPVTLDTRQSGTTTRFLTALAGGASQPIRITADPQMQGRPMSDLIDALRHAGTIVVSDGEDGTVPLVVQPPDGSGAATMQIRGDATSQFLSGLLLSGPLHPGGLTIELTTPLVSEPYVDMTLRVMEAFMVTVERDDHRFHIPPASRYMSSEFTVEPDASGASYFFAVAAIHGGRIAVPGLGRDSLQGDLGFVHLLEQMGATVELGQTSTSVIGPDQLHGIAVDMRHLSDTVPTLAVVAAFADSPTRITGIGFIRKKESDRIGNVVRELKKAGVHAEEEDDGMVIDPTRGAPHAARLETYDDHRLAMAFALLGVQTEGIEITGPTCVNKTYPGYWAALRALRP